VDAATEIARVAPVIRALRASTMAPISVDTYKAEVAEAALNAGADLVNDVWGLRMDARMGPLLAEAGVPVVLMHNRSRPRDVRQQAGLGGRYVDVPYVNLMADLLRELDALVETALGHGIAEDRIILDPGIGFGKTVEQNLAIINRLNELRALGYPLLLGPSRKSFIGYTLDLAPDQRVEGTLAACLVGLMRGGADILRVHDVLPVSRAVRMAEAILAAGGG
jgi:dihydropteroate synthase